MLNKALKQGRSKAAPLSLALCAMSIREAIIEEIDLLAHPAKQLEYEKNVPIANVPAELICGFCDDLYHPKSEQMLSEFTEDELKELAHLYGVLCEAARLDVVSVLDLIKLPKWRAVVAVAKELNAYYERNT
ncbi:MAG: hypothetical protein ACQES2_08135 [Pseudomonadota bacterium]